MLVMGGMAIPKAEVDAISHVAQWTLQLCCHA
jgi:hypothetical protein